MLGFRPEDVTLAKPGDADSFRMVVDNVENLGSDGYIYGRIIGSGGKIDGDDAAMSDQNLMTTVRVRPEDLPSIGDTVSIRLEAADMHLFAPSTGERIN